MRHTHRNTRRLLIAACAALILATWGCSESPTGPGFDSSNRASGTDGLFEPQATAGSNYVTVLVDATVTAVTDNNNDLGGGVSVGDRVRGYYVYDMTAPDIDSRPDRGAYLYSGMPNRVSFRINGLTFASNPSATAISINLRDDQAPGNPRDRCDIASTGNLDVLPGVAVNSIQIALVDGDASALSSDRLTDAPTRIDEWTAQRTLTISGAFTVTADVTNVRVRTPRRKEPHDHDPLTLLDRN